MSIEKEKLEFEDSPPLSVSSKEGGHDLDSEARRRKVLRKMDWHLLPFISLLYFLSFLDRSNIGNARVAGMAQDVGLTGLKYNVVAAVFFIPYALAEVPSNICLKLVRPSLWIPSIMLAWGIVMTLMCFCNTYKSLIVARTFLGLAEAGLFPGVTFYLALWYRRRDVGRRIAIFFSAATVAGAFSGLLAFGIEKMEGLGGLHGWQWIFCLEGLLTVITALLSRFFMYDYPETASFLTEEDRRVLSTMLKEDQQGMAKHFEWRFVVQTLADYKTYVLVGIFLGLLIPAYAVALFTAVIVNTLGFSAADSQLLSIPPFAAGCIATIACGVYSDKVNRRGLFVIGGCIISMVGFIILYVQNRPGVSYFGAFLAAVGISPTIPVLLAWASNAVGGDIQKGVTVAMVIGIGNLGGVCSSFIYISPPRFFEGHGTCMGCLGFSIVLSVFAIWDYNRLNERKMALCKKEQIDESRVLEFSHMGNESPLFRYTL